MNREEYTREVFAAAGELGNKIAERGALAIVQLSTGIFKFIVWFVPTIFSLTYYLISMTLLASCSLIGLAKESFQNSKK